MKHWYRLNNFLLLAAIVAMPAAFLYQGHRGSQIAAAHEALGYEPMNCSYIGILYAFLMMGFIYLIPFLIWNFALRNRLKNHWSIWLQLSIIFIIGITPGLLIGLWGFFAK